MNNLFRLFFTGAVVLSSIQVSIGQTVELSEKVIQKKVTINCSIEKTWWKWSTHEGLLTFFGEDNKIDFRPGGDFEIYFSMTPPVGQRGSEGCKILSYLPNNMISFTWNVPPKFPDLRNSKYHTWVVVTMSEIDKNKTEVTITHLGWPKDPAWDPVYDYFVNAWPKVADWLDKSCSQAPDTTTKTN
jgi:uncharacterized protein YndB with AHSA1/START domain